MVPAKVGKFLVNAPGGQFNQQHTKMNNIYLIGPMGSGKTTIGRQLAKRLEKDFYDSDREIEQRSGVQISLIFEIEGEEGFRIRESRMLKELAAFNGCVVATGGGCILSEENRQCLKSSGTIIYLKSSIELLYERTRKDRKRPLLDTENPRARIEELLAERATLYEGLADLVVCTDNSSIHYVVNNICAHLEQ